MRGCRRETNTLHWAVGKRVQLGVGQCSAVWCKEVGGGGGGGSVLGKVTKENI